MRASGWVWLAIAVAAVAMETLGVLRGRGTASEHLRRLAGVEPPRPWRPLGVVLVVLGCIWLVVHLTASPECEKPRAVSEWDWR